METLHKIINKFIRHYEVDRIKTAGNVVYLTFDDGPEPGITGFVLDELGKYGFKATFFCRGDNAEKHPELLEQLRTEGHAIGNHTYSHLHAYNVSAKEYLNDVEKADRVLHTSLFRPPHGSLTFRTWWRLRKRTIVFWSLNSGDSDMERFDYENSMSRLKSKTKPGGVVLFHFCHKHENETKKILPAYLKWLSENGLEGKAME